MSPPDEAPAPVVLIEVAPGRWRVRRPQIAPARSRVPTPYVISDEMDALEQGDGVFYTSKAKFRAVGRALGLTEVGNDPQRFRRKTRGSISAENARKRREAFHKAAAEWRMGRRPKHQQGD